MTVLEPGAHPPTDLQTLATPPLFNREEAVSGMSGGVAAVLGVAGLVGAVIIGFAYGTGMRPNMLGFNPGPRMPANPSQSTARTTDSRTETQRLDVTAREFAFSPAKFSIEKPGPIVVNFTNAGVVEHDFTITGVTGRAHALPASKGTGTFDLTKPGTYAVMCSIPGHKEAGMVATLVVGEEGGTRSVAATGSAPAVAAVPTMIAAKPGLAPLPAPQIALPIGAREATTVKVDLETREVSALLADGITYTYWTFNGTVPGPMIRVRQGDTVELTLRNSAQSLATHSIDLHAVTGQGGGAAFTQIAPGTEATFKFKALNPGVYVFHCATPMVAHHISNGMYGLIVVEPPGGLAPVDREYYIMEGDIYLNGNRAQPGHQEFAVEKMLDETPTYVVFNGSVGSLTGKNALKAKAGERIRIFFGVGGPNVTSSFHVIGEIFDRVYAEGASEFNTNVQTTMVPAGGATVVEFTTEVPGTLTIVDHSLGRLEKGAAGQIVVEGDPRPEIFQSIKTGAGGAGGH